mgnify:CR=1 FL=1
MIYRFILILIVLWSPVAVVGETIVVEPGDIIVLAVNRAKAGDVIEVMPGEYRQNLDVRVAGVTVRGIEKDGKRVVLNGKYDDEAEPMNAGMWITADNVTVEGFTFENFAYIGVGVADCKDVTVRDVIVNGGMTAGVSVERAQRVTLDRIVAGNANDAAFSMGDASDCTLRNSEGFSSNTGLQLFNTELIRVENCGFYGNRLGVLVGLAPGPAVKPVRYTTILRCRIVGNKGAAAANYTTTYRISNGMGVVGWGASHTEIAECFIASNDTLGIATLAANEGGVRHLDKDAERTGAASEHTYVHHNTYVNNGLAPAKTWETTFPGIPAGDLYWDGLGERNQFQETGDLRTYPAMLVVDHGGVHTNVIHFQ